MQSWFSSTSDQTFTYFGISHLIILGVFLLGFILIIPFSKYITRNRIADRTVRGILFGLLFLSEVSYQVWAYTNGLWEAATYIPLHLCGVASLLGMVALITRHSASIKLNYFIGVVPAMIAIVTPDLPYDYEHYRFWKFFLHHMAISWTSLYLVLTTNVLITWKTLWKSFGWLVAYACLIGLINPWLGANYLYLERPPGGGTLLNVLGEGFRYYLYLGLLALCIFILMLFLFKALRKSRFY
ncbi:TIGR02206 family membrane protein [Halobacillus fulvus]|nr:TIGR02206 family membrane protein [Halobacillus fulvus]